MIGVYDFCGHYEWTFNWMEKRYGKDYLYRYYDECIHWDAQTHAKKLILEKGFEGMQEYWGHTLVDEGAEYTTRSGDDYFRIDMHDCPSKGFLIRNGLEQHEDYCDHCMGWIGPLMEEAGFSIDHEHNHKGQCWWVFHRKGEEKPAEALQSDENDVKIKANWHTDETPIDSFFQANRVLDKV